MEKRIGERYYRVVLLNYDINNVPYNIGEVYVFTKGYDLDREEATMYCREVLDKDFEFIETEEILADELKLYDEEDFFDIC